jgi:hypothetical protein
MKVLIYAEKYEARADSPPPGRIFLARNKTQPKMDTPDSLITSRIDRALSLSPEPRPYTAWQTGMANLAIVSFLALATALGMAETELVSDQDKPLWRAWGAPLGMSEYFRVFAPNLRPINWHSTAVIEFADGTL